MSLCAPLAPPRGSVGGLETIERCVQTILGGTRAVAGNVVFERRRNTRYPYPFPIRLVPVGKSGLPIIDEAVFVLGKHLSPHGLDFYGRDPLPYRRAITCFDCGSGRVIQMLMDLAWCRFCHHGWYENGGRFLQEILPNRDEPSETLAITRAD